MITNSSLIKNKKKHLTKLINRDNFGHSGKPANNFNPIKRQNKKKF